MFQVLLESRRRPTRTTPATLFAVACHVVIVAAAVSATQPILTTRPHEREHPTPLFVAPARPVVALPAAAAKIASAPALLAAPIVTPAMPTMVAVPTTIGPAPIDVRPFTGPTTAVPPTVGAGGGATDGAGMTSAILSGDQVDDPVTVIAQHSPRYPAALEAAGITGSVLVEFVVDTIGHVEADSFRVIDASTPCFEASARETIMATLFRPARARGRLVRQLAQQLVTFAASR